MTTTATTHPKCTAIHTTESMGRRKRRSADARTFGERSPAARALLLCSPLFGAPPSLLVESAVWTNGPEDRFFCGYKWDDPDCRSRQHCPSGESEECEGHEELGLKCFANTNCDTRFGDGDWFVSGEPPKQSPGGTERPTYSGRSDDDTDYYWCGVGMDDARNKCGKFENHCPGGASSECPPGNICYHNIYSCDARNLAPPTASPITNSPTSAPIPAGPTKIPTEMPFGPPDPLPYPSVDPTDHWFCGIGLGDANEKCGVHCPTASECPMFHICYFATICDARTHSPTPPPTRRPTDHPIPLPTLSPTFTMPPTPSPTFTSLPTTAPSEQGPTQSPTKSPTKRPTYAPMPSLQASFFCGTDWNDAITHCKRRCPTGESTECPFDEKCFSMTPCTEELGYPEDYGLVDGGGSGGSNGNEGGEACVPFVVTIVADHWPKETSWTVENTEIGGIIAEGGNDDLVPGTPVEFVECVNNRNGCYEFTIKDSGGDGICCEHGDGSYTVSYDGVELAQGSAFYDSEKAPFGFCGSPPDTELPTKKPTKSVSTIGGGGGNSGGSAYRCIANPLVESGYEVSSDKCHLFVDCFNQYIHVGDDFFCNGNELCVETSACGGVTDENPHGTDDVMMPPPPATTSPPTDRPTPEPTPPPVSSPPTDRPMPEPTRPPVSSPLTDRPTSKTLASRPVVARPKPGPKPLSKPTQAEVSVTKSEPPTPSPTTVNSPSAAPMLPPTTYRPTYGPCGGAKCNQEDHCRSKYGFCGPGDTYCNDNAIWTNDCQSPAPSVRPTLPPVSEPPTNSPASLKPTASLTVLSLDNTIEVTESPTARSPPTMRPSTMKPKPKPSSGGFKKPSGGKKNTGGKGSLSKPAMPQLPVTVYPTKMPSTMPTDAIVTTSRPTVKPTSYLQIILDNPIITPPSPRPTRPPSKWPTKAPTWAPITPVPTREVYVDHPSSATLSKGDTMEINPVVNTPETKISPSSVLDTSSADDGQDCSGDPCPVDNHCRSRYGSCGPGFIYCNLYSIWRNTCPPIVPGTRPTKTPTARPTKSPVTFVAPTSARPTKSPIKTFPPLAKPSLPTITVVKPFTRPSTFSTTDEGEEPDKPRINDANEPEPSASPSQPESNPGAKSFQSEAYLDEWATGRREWNGSAPCTRSKKGQNILSAAITLTFFAYMYS
mmetsp:Transcript_47574/g.101088  ORF Transcript_47574/g.101088 Transcript_47574/m.101088 type:complete len:1167 (+) Transcript_47574:165-3665(+)